MESARGQESPALHGVKGWLGWLARSPTFRSHKTLGASWVCVCVCVCVHVRAHVCKMSNWEHRNAFLLHVWSLSSCLLMAPLLPLTSLTFYKDKEKSRQECFLEKSWFAQCSASAWVGGEFGGELIHVYIWVSLFAVHLCYGNIVNWLYPSTI